MGRIAIVTDSTSDIPKDLQEAHGICIVPLNVHFENEVVKDHTEITSAEFFDRLPNERIIPRTSQPAPGEFLAAYHALRDDGYDEIVSVHISTDLSGTHQSAAVAAEMAEGVEVRVIDSRTTSMGLSWCAVEGARAAAEGRSLDEVVAVVEEVCRRMSIYFVVDTLEYLEKNGRIGKSQAFLGTLLKFKPVLRINGVVEPVERLRGKGRVVRRLVEIFENEAGGAPNVVSIIQGAAEKEAEELQSLLEDHPLVKHVRIGAVGPVLGCHSGPGIIGLCFYRALE